jgi:hypothetical protein
VSEAIRVDVGECRCPGTPHASDWVDLEPELTLAMASGALFAMKTADSTTSSQMAAIAGAYLPAGIREWSFTEGKVPVPVDRENMERLMPWDKGGLEVTEAADALYSERLMAPLVKRLSPSAPDGQTEKPMSPIPLSGHTPRKSSLRSSHDGSDTPKSAAAGH